MSTVFQMVRQVLADSKEKLASEQGTGRRADSSFKKTAAETCSDCGHQKGSCPEDCGCSTCSEAKTASGFEYDPVKVADACDYLADNLHLVVDSRSPQEKLAEYVEIRNALEKAAADEPQGPHQTTKANPDSISPMNPSATNSAQAGAGANQMASGQASASGTGIETDSGGTATPSKVISTEAPTEKAFPTDAADCCKTNRTDAPGGSAEMIQKVASMRARKLAQLASGGHISKEAAAIIILKDRVKVAQFQKEAGVADLALKGGKTLLSAGKKGLSKADSAVRGVGRKLTTPVSRANISQAGEVAARKGGAGFLDAMRAGGKAVTRSERLRGAAAVGIPVGLAATGLGVRKAMNKEGQVPSNLARAIMAKFAEDAINPAQISGGTEPVLQSVSGVPSPMSQGTEVGEQVPNTEGSDSGRNLISSVMAAINATKGDAKNVKSEMAKYLNEPAMSSAHDSVMQQSLDNTSSAGVKIAATRTLLQKWAEQSSDHKAVLSEAARRVKLANEMMGYGAEAPASAVAPPGAGTAGGGMSMPAPGDQAMGGPKMADGEEAEPVSDAALAAAAQGVSPEEVAAAEELLEAQMAPPADAAMEAPPAEGAPPPAMPEGGAPPMAGPPAVA